MLDLDNIEPPLNLDIINQERNLNRPMESKEREGKEKYMNRMILGLILKIMKKIVGSRGDNLN